MENLSKDFLILIVIVTVATVEIDGFYCSKAYFRHHNHNAPTPNSEFEIADVGNPLILTPYIVNKNLEEGKRLARNSLSGIEGYSGYLTVNSTYNSNLFFWFFPAEVNPETADVLVWLNGGPGASSLLGLFAENGPYRIDKENKLRLRKFAWTKIHSVIYFDQPVGTGFSFTDDDAGYATNEHDIVRDLYSALIQFFNLFPQFIERHLYITGESYGGKYVPALTHEIHVKNQGNPTLKLNLKGMAIGNGYSDPENMQNFGNYLYNVGLIDSDEQRYFHQEEEKIRNAIRLKRWTTSYKLLDKLMFGDETSSTYFSRVTGFDELVYYNFLQTKSPADQNYYIPFVQQPVIRKSIHVGNRLFDNGTKVERYLREDFQQSVVPWIVTLLESNYKIMFYCGQLDISIPCISTEEMLKKMPWSGNREYHNSPKTIWKVGEDIAGYVRKSESLLFVVVRNAGHILPYDQPKWAFDMINRFTVGKPFTA